MIGFKDFQKPSKWFGLGTGPMAGAVREANAWINSHAVIVLNIETIRATGGIAGMSSTSEEGVRVWYIEDDETDAPRVLPG